MTKIYKHSIWFASMVCGLGAIYYSYEYFLRISPSVMEHALREHFHLSATDFGFLSAFYYYAYVPMQLPVGLLLDRFGPRLLLPFACLVCVIGTFIFSGTQIFWVALLGRFLVGFGSAFAFVGVLKLATIWLPEDKLAMVSGMTSALGTIGGMVGDNLLGALVTNVGWKETLDYAGYVGLGLVILLRLGIHDKNTKHYVIQDVAQKTIHTFSKCLKDLRIIITNTQVWMVGIYACLVYLPTTVFAELWGIPYLEHAHHMTSADADFANSLIFLGFTVGAPLMGYISDRVFLRRLPMLLGAIGACIVMTTIMLGQHLSFFTIDMLMFALGVLYSVQSISFAVGRELSPTEAGATAMATVNMICMLGAMFLQPLVGRLLDYHHSIRVHATDLLHHTHTSHTIYSASDYQFAVAVIPVGILIAAILVYFVKETHANTK
jgi:sugar phosphate permease